MACIRPFTLNISTIEDKAHALVTNAKYARTSYIQQYEKLMKDKCLTCKNIICQKCFWNFKNHKFKPDDDYIEDYEYFGELDEDGFAEGCPGQDCPIICPFCCTKDYKIFYGNQMPYELLNEIKNSRFIND